MVGFIFSCKLLAAGATRCEKKKKKQQQKRKKKRKKKEGFSPGKKHFMFRCGLVYLLFLTDDLSSCDEKYL